MRTVNTHIIRWHIQFKKYWKVDKSLHNPNPPYLSKYILTTLPLCSTHTSFLSIPLPCQVHCCIRVHCICFLFCFTTLPQTLCLDSHISDFSSNTTSLVRLSQKSLSRLVLPLPLLPPFLIIWFSPFPLQLVGGAIMCVCLLSATHLHVLECELLKSRSPACPFTTVSTVPKGVNT